MTSPLISFLTILISLSFLFFYIKPAYLLNQVQRENLATLSNVLKNSDDINILVSQAEKDLNSVPQNQIDRFAVFLPETSDPIRFVHTIQNIARLNGIILADIVITEKKKEFLQMPGSNDSSGVARGLEKTFSLEKPIPDKNQESVQDFTTKNNHVATRVNLVFTAPYDVFQLFLNNLEQSLELINVKSVSFIPVKIEDVSKKKNSVQLYQYNITIETYSLK